MADDFQIQQTQTSVAPYAATGATLGAVGGGAAAYYFTQPKYGSFDDIVEETSDKDKFEKKITDAAEEDKQFLKDMREYAGKEEAGLAEYDKLLEEYKAQNATGEKIETDDYKKLVNEANEKKTALTNAEKAVTDAETAYNAKQAEFTAKETDIATRRAALEAEMTEQKVSKKQKPAWRSNRPVNHTELQRKIAEKQAAIRAEERNIKELSENFNSVFRQHAEELSKLSGDKVNKKWAYIESNIDSMIERMDFTGTQEEIKAAKEAKRKEIRQFIQDMVAEYDHNNGTIKVDVPKIVKSRNDAFQSIKDITKLKQDMFEIDAEELRKQLRKAKPDARPEEIQKRINQITEARNEELQRRVGQFRNAEDLKVQKLQKLLDAYREYAANAKAAGQPVVTIREYSAILFGKERKLPGKFKITEYTKPQTKTFFESLSDKDIETLKRLVGNNANEKSIEATIKGHKDKIASLDKALADINAANEKIAQFGGEGAYIKNGVIYKADGTKAQYKPKQITLADRVEIPASKKELEKLQRELRGLESQLEGKTIQVPKYTAEQINEMLADDTVKLEELKQQAAQNKQVFDRATTAKQAAADAQQAAETARQAAYDKLETKPAKTADELVKEFNEKNNVTGREDFAKGKANAAKEELVKKYGEKLKRRFGFAEHTNAKIAAAALGCAAVFGGLFALFAPKDNA